MPQALASVSKMNGAALELKSGYARIGALDRRSLRVRKAVAQAGD